MSKYDKRILAIREKMQSKNIDACIIPYTDNHLSEYPAPPFKFIEYISGFTGSAGTLVITKTQTGLWTDSRYFLQASKQLKESGITLHRDGLQETLSIEEWIVQDENINNVGIDGNLFSVEYAETLIEKLEENEIDIETDFTTIDTWKDRPELPKNKFFLFQNKYNGYPVSEKIEYIQQILRDHENQAVIISALDELAYIFNIRCNDIPCNPVGLAFGIIDQKDSFLFTDKEKITEEVNIYLKQNNINLKDYSDISNFIKIKKYESLEINRNNLNYDIYSNIPENTILDEDSNIIYNTKAIKNDTEIKNIKTSMIKDGVALSKFWIWLEKATLPEKEITEYEIGQQIANFRKEQKDYFSESFEPIVGFNENAAIVHYSPKKDNSAKVNSKGTLLIDTGAQYLTGTTDITRTFSINGEPSEDFKKDYTIVLKAHISIANAIFKTSTKGSQIDIFAKKQLWENKLDFMHGTGHGVGFFLNVHEGPQRISPSCNTPFSPGMITSNEPGYYKANAYGIRLENLTLCQYYDTGEFEDFLNFETLTLLPFDLKCINKNLLDSKEINWLNNYHESVFIKLSPFLNDTEKKWLKTKTNKI